MVLARPSSPRFPAAESPASARRRGTAAVALGLVVLGSGCFVGDQTLAPPAESLYYPTGLVRSPGGSTLYVVNSDFDLQYDGGTVLSLDLARLRGRLVPQLDALRKFAAGSIDLKTACAAGGTIVNNNTNLNPGPCLALALTEGAATNQAQLPSATIGAFASGAVFVKRAGEDATDARLFIPVRGDPSITFLNVQYDSDGKFVPRLDCTGSVVNTPGARCDNAHRIGIDPFESTRAIVLPTEPVGIAASEDGTAIVVAHQTENAVSLSIDDPTQRKPTLEFLLGNLPAGPTDVATVPIPKLFKDQVESAPPTIDYQRGFLVTYRSAPVVDLIRVHKDESGTSRPYLTRSNETTITVNADGKDSRGVAVDSRARAACEAACAQGDHACLLPCLDIPLDIYIANRTPASLLIGRIETTTVPEHSQAPSAAFDRIFITDSVPLATGAAKVVVGDVIDPKGELSPRVFVGTFDSRFVFSYDPKARRVDAVFSTGRGPQALEFDYGFSADVPPKPTHAFLLVGHFTDSYLGVVDLDMGHPETFGTMFASVGAPTPPKDSQ